MERRIKNGYLSAGPAWVVEGCQGEVHLGHELSALVEVGRGPGIYLVQGAPRHIPVQLDNTSAANRLIGEVVQSRRRPLLGPSPG